MRTGAAGRAFVEFREGDKRLYRAAKSRWQAISARRKSTAQASVLIADARARLAAIIAAMRAIEGDPPF